MAHVCEKEKNDKIWKMREKQATRELVETWDSRSEEVIRKRRSASLRGRKGSSRCYKSSGKWSCSVAAL